MRLKMINDTSPMILKLDIIEIYREPGQATADILWRRGSWQCISTLWHLTREQRVRDAYCLTGQEKSAP